MSSKKPTRKPGGVRANHDLLKKLLNELPEGYTFSVRAQTRKGPSRYDPKQTFPTHRIKVKKTEPGPYTPAEFVGKTVISVDGSAGSWYADTILKDRVPKGLIIDGDTEHEWINVQEVFEGFLNESTSAPGGPTGKSAAWNPPKGKTPAGRTNANWQATLKKASPTWLQLHNALAREYASLLVDRTPREQKQWSDAQTLDSVYDLNPPFPQPTTFERTRELLEVLHEVGATDYSSSMTREDLNKRLKAGIVGKKYDVSKVKPFTAREVKMAERGGLIDLYGSFSNQISARSKNDVAKKAIKALRKAGKKALEAQEKKNAARAKSLAEDRRRFNKYALDFKKNKEAAEKKAEQAAKKAEAKAQRERKAAARKKDPVSPRLRASQAKESQNGTFLVFNEKEDFERAVVRLAMTSGSTGFAEVDSSSMQIRLRYPKDSSITANAVISLRRGPTSRMPNRRRLKFKVYNPAPARRFHADRNAMKLSDAELEILDTTYTAILDDPSPKSGRQYMASEDEYRVASRLLRKGLLRKIDSGSFDGEKWVHVGITESGLVARMKAEQKENTKKKATKKKAFKKKATKKKATKKKATKKKATKKKATKKKAATIEVVKFERGKYEWRILSGAGRKLESGNSRKKANAVKTSKAKAKKRGHEKVKVTHRDATARELKAKGMGPKKAKVAKNRCARKGPISSPARKELPNHAFALQRDRKYPLYKMGGDGKLIPSASHASNAKARARQALDNGSLTRASYNTIIRKANKVLGQCGTAAKKAKKAASRKRSRDKASIRRQVMAEVNRLAGL